MATITDDGNVASNLFPSISRESLFSVLSRGRFPRVSYRQVCIGTMETNLTFEEFCSRGGKAHRGSEFAKERARKAAQTRWTKYRTEKERAEKEVK